VLVANVPSRSAAPTAASYDIVVRFPRDGLRALLVLGPALGLAVLVFIDRPGGADILVIAPALVVFLGAIQLLGQPADPQTGPGRPQRRIHGLTTTRRRSVTRPRCTDRRRAASFIPGAVSGRSGPTTKGVSMLQVTRTAAMQRWTVELTETDALFSYAALAEGQVTPVALPRVWPGRGLGLPAHELAGFVAALVEIMKTPRFWHAWHLLGSRASRGGELVWAMAFYDPDDEFVYVGGPCGRRDDSVDYHAVHTFSVALADVRALRIRLTAYLHVAT
jgi:hypothetical protein